jgi:hypothetical protein
MEVFVNPRGRAALDELAAKQVNVQQLLLRFRLDTTL